MKSEILCGKFLSDKIKVCIGKSKIFDDF